MYKLLRVLLALEIQGCDPHTLLAHGIEQLLFSLYVPLVRSWEGPRYSKLAPHLFTAIQVQAMNFQCMNLKVVLKAEGKLSSECSFPKPPLCLEHTGRHSRPVCMWAGSCRTHMLENQQQTGSRSALSAIVWERWSECSSKGAAPLLKLNSSAGGGGTNVG